MRHVDGVIIGLVSEVAWLKCEVSEGESEGAGVLCRAAYTAAEVLTRARETRYAWV